MEAFPDAKVVLTVRKASTWPESVKNAIMRSQRIAMTFPASWIIWIRGATDKIKVSNLILLAPPISLEHTVLQKAQFQYFLLFLLTAGQPDVPGCSSPLRSLHVQCSKGESRRSREMVPGMGRGSQENCSEGETSHL